MMFRPRALNMIDHSVKIGEQPLNGGLMDFAIIMFNNAQKIIEKSPSYEARQVLLQFWIQFMITILSHTFSKYENLKCFNLEFTIWQ
mgnify:CR=1 FL=1